MGRRGPTNPYPVAPPGTSLHESGLAVDVPLGFVPTLLAVAADAGLCQPLPETDPVHFEPCPPSSQRDRRARDSASRSTAVDEATDDARRATRRRTPTPTASPTQPAPPPALRKPAVPTRPSSPVAADATGRTDEASRSKPPPTRAPGQAADAAAPSAAPARKYTSAGPARSSASSGTSTPGRC